MRLNTCSPDCSGVHSRDAGAALDSMGVTGSQVWLDVAVILEMMLFRRLASAS